MKKLYILAALATLAALDWSCTAALQKRYDQRHGTSTDRSSRDGDTERSYPSDRNYQSERSTQTDNAAYRKDYDRVVDASATSGSPGDNNPDYNQRLLNQYADMDKLGEVVLYELDNLDNRYNNLLTEYKSAKSSQRQVIAPELDKISDKRLTLYKAYTNIYRNGKTDWPNVKRDVENTLKSIRD